MIPDDTRARHLSPGDLREMAARLPRGPSDERIDALIATTRGAEREAERRRFDRLASHFLAGVVLDDDVRALFDAFARAFREGEDVGA